MKKIYLKDIAQNLNLSKTTVSLVLNGRGDEIKISQETQEKIINYAKKHNYVPNQLARSLSRGRSETIGLIIPNISDTFYAEIASCVEKKAEEFGFTVVFSSSYENVEREEKLIRSMLNRQVDGLIIASTQQNLKDIKALKSSNFPFVLIDRHYPETSSNYVVVDNYKGMQNATEHLLKLGRKKIALVTVSLELEAIKQRLLGYKNTINNHFNKEVAIIKELHPSSYKDEMSHAIKSLIETHQVDAILFTTHYLTALGLREIKNNGSNIPKDVAIISFDELSAFDLFDPPITSVIQPREKIGHLAMEILIDKIGGKVENQDQSIVLETKLKIRKSCGI